MTLSITAMNKILTSTGGYPLRLEDIEDLQGFIGDVLKGIAAAFGDCILSGCEIREAGNDRHIMPGYICYRGNIYKVSQDTISVPDVLFNRYYWVFSEEATRTVVYEDGHEEASRHLYTARLVVGITEPTEPHLPHNILPRLGVDFARPGCAKCRVTGAGLSFIDFTQISPYSGILTFESNHSFDPDEAKWEISLGDGIHEISGMKDVRCRITRARSWISATLTVIDDIMRITPHRGGEYRSGDNLFLEGRVSLLISWRYKSESEPKSDRSTGIRNRHR